jgi:ferredoxin
MDDATIAAFVGSTSGTSGTARVELITDSSGADRLVFDSTCRSSIVPFVRKATRALGRGKKVGVAAKGCDGRALVQHIAEGQLVREDLAIVGLECAGVSGGRSHSGSGSLSESCRRCRYPVPPVHDLLIPANGDGPKAESRDNEFNAVTEFEKLGPDVRWAYFQAEAAKCIRCYACRNACPMCYCDECFVDRTAPQWFGKSAERPDTLMFHLVRALHNAGRCVDCGTCERACPAGVRISLLGKRLEREVRERFGYTAGLGAAVKPAMAAFAESDAQEFIL